MRHLLRNALIAAGVLGVGYLVFKPKDAPASGSPPPPDLAAGVKPGDVVEASVKLPGGFGAFTQQLRVTQVVPGAEFVSAVMVQDTSGVGVMQVPRANITRIVQRA